VSVINHSQARADRISRHRLASVQPQVALTPACAECGDVWLPADTDRWKLHLDVDDDPVWFCPDCDAREFGDG